MPTIFLQTLLAEVSSRLAAILHVGKHGYHLRLNINTDQFARQLSGARKVVDSKKAGVVVQGTEHFGRIEHLPLVSILAAYAKRFETYSAYQAGNCPL